MRRLRLEPLGVWSDDEAPEGFRLSERLVLTTGMGAVRVRRSLEGEVLVPNETRFELAAGDVVWRGSEGWVIEPTTTVRERALELEAVSRWEDAARWGVLADRLLDHGDRLGERISTSLGQQSSRPIAPHTWIGAKWRHGVLQRVAITRPEWAAHVPWREALLEILVAPQARFLEELSLDLPRLEPEATPDELRLLAQGLLTLPWPRWLNRLHFGVGTSLSLSTPQALLDEHPRLSRTSLFGGGERASLVLEATSDRLALEGLARDRTSLAEGLRVRVFPTKVLFERPVWPRYDSWPSWDFAFHEGRWFLSWRHGAPRSNELTINGMEFFNACLVPGDRIEIGEHVTLRFELG